MNPRPAATPDEISSTVLTKGWHRYPDDGLNLMELVSWAGGEGHTDHPACCSDVLQNLGRGINDCLPAAYRQMLLPSVEALARTGGDGRDQARRWAALDWYMRTWLPGLFAWQYPRAARSLRRLLAPIADQEAVCAAVPVLAAGHREVTHFAKRNSRLWPIASWKPNELKAHLVAVQTARTVASEMMIATCGMDFASVAHPAKAIEGAATLVWQTANAALVSALIPVARDGARRHPGTSMSGMRWDAFDACWDFGADRVADLQLSAIEQFRLMIAGEF